jgi:excisionase family DNA binding protein
MANTTGNIDLNREYLRTSEAAKRSNLSKPYLTQLLRAHILEGFQLGREWFIYTDSLDKFVATPRKSGPKGPRKKTLKESQNKTPKQEEDNRS